MTKSPVNMTKSPVSTTLPKEIISSDGSVNSTSGTNPLNVSGTSDEGGILTTELPSETNSNSCGRHFKLVLSFIITGSMCVLGLVGNSLSTLIMWPERKTNSTSFALIFLAFVDNLLLCSRFLMRSVPAICGYLGQCRAYMLALNVELSLIGWLLVSCLQMMTTYATVIVISIRYVAVCVPHRFKILASVKRIKLVSLIDWLNEPKFCISFSCFL